MSEANTVQKTLGKAGPWVAVGVALIVIPILHFAGVISIETVNQLGRYLCFAIVALGIDLVWGYTGILSLCQAMFFCLGAYAIGMHMALHGPMDGDGKAIPRCLFVVSSEVSGMKLPWFWYPFKSLPIALILGVVIPGTAAAIFGYVAFRSRVRGVYFSIITQAATLATWLVLSLNQMRLCGTNGLTNFEKLAGFDVRDNNVKFGLYVASVLALIASYLACRHLVNSRLGRILVAIRDNESRLRFSGYQPLFYKVFAFTAAAMLAGLGGMLYCTQQTIIAPSDMRVELSITMVVWVAFGGRGTLSGAIAGALAINFTYSSMTSRAPDLWPFVLGLLAVCVVLFFPEGLIGLWRRLIGTNDGDAHPMTAGIISDDSEVDTVKPVAPARTEVKA